MESGQAGTYGNMHRERRWWNFAVALSKHLRISGHRYGWSRGIAFVNSAVFMTADGEWFTQYWSSMITIYTIAVDCFLVLSGCLLARSILGAIEK
jgi:peptidoglycan/LPS O-acetylase OafA/YrhL